MKNIKIIIIIIVGIIISIFLFTIFLNIIDKLILIYAKNRNQQEIIQNEIDIKSNKDTIYELFNNFPESDNIYYISKNLYSERSIGHIIYQLDILAELTDEGYNNFIKQVEFQDSQNFEIKINPKKINYNWKEIKNIKIIESKDIETASIKNIYLDESEKTIYIIAIGGN